MNGTTLIWQAAGSWSTGSGRGGNACGARQVCEIKEVEMATVVVIGVAESGFDNRSGADRRSIGVCEAWGVNEVDCYIEIGRSAKLGMGMVMKVCDGARIIVPVGHKNRCVGRKRDLEDVRYTGRQIQMLPCNSLLLRFVDDVGEE
jgi:hypothetical protein